MLLKVRQLKSIRFDLGLIINGQRRLIEMLQLIYLKTFLGDFLTKDILEKTQIEMYSCIVMGKNGDIRYKGVLV